jgi:hypothetical protein
MILLIQDRDDNLHLVDYTSITGNKFTLCNLVYCKRDIINTLALDNTVHNICRTCRDNYTSMYTDDLFFDPRMLHSAIDLNMKSLYADLSYGKDWSLKVKYQNDLERNNPKINRLQRKILRK